MSRLARKVYERSGQLSRWGQFSTLYSMRPSAEVTSKLATVTVQALLDLKPVLPNLDVYEDTEAKGMSPITIWLLLKLKWNEVASLKYFAATSQFGEVWKPLWSNNFCEKLASKVQDNTAYDIKMLLLSLLVRFEPCAFGIITKPPSWMMGAARYYVAASCFKRVLNCNQ